MLPVSLGGFWKNFLFYVVASSRISHLESVQYFRVPLFGSLCSVRLGVAYEYEKLDSWEMPFSRVQYFVRLWIHVL